MAAIARRNPYIIGRPITEPEAFFGRESLFNFVNDNLRQNVQVLLLHGQRRIGKSSVLCQLPHSTILRESFKFVLFDLQDKSQLSLGHLLHDLATEILFQLELEDDQVKLPTTEELELDSNLFSDPFLMDVAQALGNKRLVLLLDEFDVLGSNDPNSAGRRFFPYLKQLLTQHKQLFIIPVIGRKLDDLPNLQELFKGAPHHEIGLLDEVSARRLITQPAIDNSLKYDDSAINEVIRLSAGHPYFTQVVCFAVFVQARERNSWRITHSEVRSIVELAIETAEGGLAWFWDGLTVPEQVIFSAVSKAQEEAIASQQSVAEDPLVLLRAHGVIETEELQGAVKQLVDRGFLVRGGREVRVELVRRWLLRRYPLYREILALEHFHAEAKNIYEIAERLRIQQARANDQGLYQQVIVLNPNHFNTLFRLAEISLNDKDYSKAVELYTRAYQVDPIRNREGLVRSLLEHGNHLFIQQENPELAKGYYQRVTEIEPDNVLAQDKLKEILVWEGKLSLKSDLKRKYQSRTAAIAAVGIPLLLLVGYFWGRGSNPCPEGQIVDGICQPSQTTVSPQANIQQAISRGEQAFFTSISNADRNEGIEAFKLEKYAEASQWFQKAVENDPFNPEVLIYYNNALARQQGKPFTLAVAIPAGDVLEGISNKAQEILRGVAQAQNEFNQKQEPSGRLLEIVIANDKNDPDNQAKQIAQALVQDESVLGVIGHYTSKVSKAVLSEYETAKLPIVTPTSTSTDLQSEVFFRTLPSDTATGHKLAEYARETLNLERAVIFYNTEDAYSRSIRDAFAKRFEELEGTIIPTSDFKTDLHDPNFNPREAVPRIFYRHKAEAAVLFPNATLLEKVVDIAKANTELVQGNSRLTTGLKLLGGDSLYDYQEILKNGGANVEGLVVAAPWFAQSPESANFSQSASSQWGGRQVSWRTATSFDATQVFIETLTPDASRETVLQNLPQVELSADETSGRALKFNAAREQEIEPVLVKVINGEFQLITQ